MNTNLPYRIALWVVALALLVVLFSCAGGAGEAGAQAGQATVRVAGDYTPEKPMRLVLGGSVARDSAAVVTEFYVDQALRAACDSIPAARYVTINFRDSLAKVFVAEGRQGIPIAELGKRLDLDGVVFTRIARFSSVLAVEMRVVNPASGAVLFRDLSFSMIRFRDTSGTMFLGPTVFDAVRKSLGKLFGLKHLPELPVATEPLVISSVSIPADDHLGQIRTNRQSFSTTAIKAIGELARMRYPELVAFDYESRAQLMKTVGVVAVDDFMPMQTLERQALYNVGIDRFVTSSAALVGDSIHLRVEIRQITSRTSDSLIDVQEGVYPRTTFETSKSEDDFVIALIDQSVRLFDREAKRIREAYEAKRTTVPVGK